MINEKIASIFEEYADYLELNNDEVYKIAAYRKAARVIKGLPFNLKDYVDSGKRLEDIKGVGKAISKKILEILETGTLSALEEIKKNTPNILIEMTKIPGLGPKKAYRLYNELKINSIGELEYACKENRLLLLQGFGKKSQENILKGLEYYKKHKDKHLFFEAEIVADEIKKSLSHIKGVDKVEFAGSLRRKVEVIKDIDFVILVNNLIAENSIINFLKSNNIEIIESGEKLIRFNYKNINVDVRFASKENFVTMLHHFTGSKNHNEVLRMKAKSLRLKINEYGIFKGEEKLNIDDEQDIYNILGLSYIVPELREGYYEFGEKSINSHKLIELKDLKGVFHVHTVWSDGIMQIKDLIEIAQIYGYEYIGVSDHSKSSRIANGLDENRAIKQIEAINQVNTENSNLILKGIECDILVDGSLDFDDDILSKFDFVIASVHSHFNMTKGEMTKRLVKALSNKHVNIFGHPTGRLLLSRNGYEFDEDEIYRVCKYNNVVIELNANPYRLDIDWRKMEYVHKYDLMVAINPDAHNKQGFNDIIYGINIARKGGLDRRKILNSYSYAKAIEILKK
ncbi:DNA polymerase/3'-5' exonuclease PolX [Deferribacter thermophilus]|uniref:DNA polymerase/3'-5' exonuclease PolX n=1 Tax=Deferribacter thermophilus TaxID=53573 RepID=UPI003C201437